MYSIPKYKNQECKFILFDNLMNQNNIQNEVKYKANVLLS